MNLGMARRKFAEDPAAAESLVAEAHAEAKQALVELRDLARGIHTSVLTDRGLDAALSALARRVGVPVEVSVDLPHRLPVAVESAAYFVVAEALTNVTRHAEASAAAVTMLAREGALLVTVQDDGRGGADPARGTGLAGLADRLAAVDGSMHIDSPVGGPTRVQVEIPCGS
jgi:signal transduction histidine kinase